MFNQVVRLSHDSKKRVEALFDRDVTKLHGVEVSVGLPVFDGAETIKETITSILNQTYTDLELIISDNKSEDGTEDICRDMARLDSRVRYIRQSDHISGLENFKHTLERSSGNYFMWNACDDYRSTNYIEENYRNLVDRPDCIGSASPNCFIGQENDRDRWVQFSLEGSTYVRIRAFMDNSFRSHGIFYGLFRRAAFQQLTFPIPEPLAPDWGIIASLLLQGPIARIDSGLFVSSRGGISESPGRISNFQYGLLDSVFPFQRYARGVLGGLLRCEHMTYIEKALVARELWRLNWKYKFRSY